MTLWCDQFDMSALPSTAPPTADPPASPDHRLHRRAGGRARSRRRGALHRVRARPRRGDRPGPEHSVADVQALLGEGRNPRDTLAESGESVAQLYAADGQVLASTRRVSGTRLLTLPEVRRAGRGEVRVDRRPSSPGDVRIRATGARTGGGTGSSSPWGIARAARPVLARLHDLLFIAGPLALLLASYAGYQVAGAALRQSSACTRAERITDRDTAGATGAGEQRRDRGARSHLQRAARPARRRASSRAEAAV